GDGCEDHVDCCYACEWDVDAAVWAGCWWAREVGECETDCDRPEDHGRDREHQVNVQSGVDRLRGLAADGVGSAFFPAVQADVDFEEDDGDEENRAERDLRPLMKCIAAAYFDFEDAPRKYRDDGEHREEHDVDHERRPRP